MLHTEAGGEQTIRDWCANSSYAYDRHVRVTLHDESFEAVTHGREPDVAPARGNARGRNENRAGRRRDGVPRHKFR